VVFAIPLRKIVKLRGIFNPLPWFCPGLLAAALLSPSSTLHAQQPQTVAADSIKNPADSLPPPKGEIETTIIYSARDSIHTSLDGKIVWLYGDAHIKYGDIELQAEDIIIDYNQYTLTAHGRRDSLGRRVGFPIFRNGPEEYETKDIVYNFKTRRARISEVVTKQGEGFLHGDVVYKNEKNELLSLRNSYTTCNLEHPHFRIRATKTKAIPGDKIVAGPFYMEFNDVPLYPVGFLFGMFPAPRKSKSGIIFPSYGEDRRLGFNLRNMGYFFDINDYMKLSLLADVYSKGGLAGRVVLPYNKRYRYNGSFNFTYSRYRFVERIEDLSVNKDFSLSWSHTPQSRGTGRFSASVNAATNTFNRNNNLNLGLPASINSNQFLNTTRRMNSNISYNKRFTGTPFTLGINFSHTQDLLTRQIDLTLPAVSLNMQNLYPFQRKDGKPTALDNFSIGYSMTASNRITNNLGRVGNAPADSIAPFTPQNLSFFFQNGKNGIRHSIPVGYSFKAFKYFTVTPSFNYTETWYFQRFTWQYDIVNNTPRLVLADTIKGFNRIGNYTTGINVVTRLYGTYFFKRGNLKAIRHTVNPTIGLSYQPDFTRNNNYFQAVNQNGKVIYQSRHQGLLYGGSSTGRSGSVNFGVSNTVEAKIKSEKDTVARKVNLLNNLSLNSSYNLMADSFKLSAVSIAANTTLFENLLNITMNASLDPYTILTITREDGRKTERRVNEYAWKSGQLGRITSATIALSTNLNPKGRESDQKTREKITRANISEDEKQYLLNNPDVYVDFDIPWKLSVNYSLSYSRGLNAPASITQALQFSGDLSLSKQWKVVFSSGYDFRAKTLTMTNLGISRDLHCWSLNFNWTPFGPFTQFHFRINAKASILQDLRLERRKPFYDNF
jgi:hypothetical protein